MTAHHGAPNPCRVACVQLTNVLDEQTSGIHDLSSTFTVTSSRVYHHGSRPKRNAMRHFRGAGAQSPKTPAHHGSRGTPAAPRTAAAAASHHQAPPGPAVGTSACQCDHTHTRRGSRYLTSLPGYSSNTQPFRCTLENSAAADRPRTRHGSPCGLRSKC
jgi:hypothetical protein